ncbi:MAG: LEA type 2 family protein [Sulfuricaulis sp.]
MVRSALPSCVIEFAYMKKLITLFFVVMLSGCAVLQSAIEPPQVTMNNLQIRDMTLLEQRYAVTLRVQNPNPIPLPISGMNFQLDINDTELGRGVSNQAVTVPAYGEALVEIRLVSNLMRIFNQIRGLESSKGQSLRYRLSGGLSISDRMGKLPFDYRGEFNPQR